MKAFYKLMAALCACTLVLAGNPSNASTVVLDFDLGSGTETVPGQSYIEDGFSITATQLHFDYSSSGGVGNTGYIALHEVFPDKSLVRLQGITGTTNVFDLVSLELAHFSAEFGEAFQGESLNLTSSAGGVSVVYWNGIHSFSGADWTDLTWIDIEGNTQILGPGFDNLILNTVPVPAAMWLFGSALGLLCWLRRKTASPLSIN